MRDVRFVKDGVARAIRTLRTSASSAPEDRVVPLSGPGRAGVEAHVLRRADHRRAVARYL